MPDQLELLPSQFLYMHVCMYRFALEVIAAAHWAPQ